MDINLLPLIPIFLPKKKDMEKLKNGKNNIKRYIQISKLVFKMRKEKIKLGFTIKRIKTKMEKPIKQ